MASEPLSPVLLALLANKAHVTADVLIQGLASLADAGWLRFEQQDPATPAVRVLRRPADDDELRWDERVALHWVMQRAGNQPDVPLSAVIERHGTDAQEWWERYAGAVHDQAKAAGLTWRLAGNRAGYAVTVASGAGLGLATAAAGGGVVLAVIVGVWGSVIPGVVLALALTAPRLTRAGRARRAVAGQALPAPEVTPLPRDQAWSSSGGRWHLVTIPTAQRTAARAALEPERKEVVGQVVKRWSESQTTESQSTVTTTTTHFCCFDDGASEEGWTFAMAWNDFDVLTVGDTIAVSVKDRGIRFVPETTAGTDTRQTA